MVNQEFPSLNDIAPSWADIQTTHTVSGGSLLDMIDYSGIKFSSKVETGEQRGASGGRVMKRTTGSLKHTASATYYRSGLRKLVKALVPLAPTRGNQSLVSLVPFDVLIQHSPPGESEIYTVKIKGCRLLGIDMSMTEGNDADKVECDINPIEIVNIIDGKEVVLL
jgi:hypothetical protein